MFSLVSLPASACDADGSCVIDAWLASEGQSVRRGAPLVRVYSGKTSTELPAPHGGTLRRVLARPGERVPAEGPLAILGPASGALPQSLAPLVQRELSSAPVPPGASRPASRPLPAAPVELPREGPPPVSPRARRRARELRVPLAALARDVAGRRIVERDVAQAAEALDRLPVTPAAREEAWARGIDLRTLRLPAPAEGPLDAPALKHLPPTPLRAPALREPLGGLRRALAEDAQFVQATVPECGLEMVVRSEPLLQLRDRLAAEWGKRDAPSLDDLLLVLLARTAAQPEFKPFRCVLDGPDAVERGSIRVGWRVPVDVNETVSVCLPDLDRTPLRSVPKMTRELQQAVKQRRLKHVQTEGALVALANLSQSGVASYRDHVRPGESAVLCIPGPQLRPIVLPEGLVGFRTTWLLHLACDRRLIEPVLGALFLQNLKTTIEAPESLLK